jgi:putative inorganic carbon (HCO3(-)) transporter
MRSDVYAPIVCRTGDYQLNLSNPAALPLARMDVGVAAGPSTHNGQHSHQAVRVARVGLEWVLVLLATPVLTFPLMFPRLTVTALGLVAVVIAFMALFDRSAPSLGELAGLYRWPWVVMAIMTFAGAIISPSPTLALPKLCGVVLGMLILRAVLLSGTTSDRIRVLAWLYLVAGLAMVLGALLVNPRWKYDYQARYSLLRMLNVVPGLPGAERGVNSNALGGSTLLFLPLSAVFLVWTLHRMAAGQRRERIRMAVQGCGYAPAVVVLSLILWLSGSHTAWISAAVAGVVLMVLRFQATAILWGPGAAVVLFAWLWFGGWDFYSFVGPGGRLVLWSLALNLIQAHPIVGVGLGAFHPILLASENGLYDTYIRFPHAHNTFLQLALDVGIPGLMAYLTLLVLATHLTDRILRIGTSGERVLGLGLWASLIAIHVFGLTDAIALGAKVGVFFWWNLGLIAALYNVAKGRPGTRAETGAGVAAAGINLFDFMSPKRHIRSSPPGSAESAQRWTFSALRSAFIAAATAFSIRGKHERDAGRAVPVTQSAELRPCVR